MSFHCSTVSLSGCGVFGVLCRHCPIYQRRAKASQGQAVMAIPKSPAPTPPEPPAMSTLCPTLSRVLRAMRSSQVYIQVAVTCPGAISLCSRLQHRDTVSPPPLVESTEPWLWRADRVPPLYIRDLSVHGFCYLRRVLEQIPRCYRDNCIQKMGQSTSSWPHPKEGLSTQRGLCSLVSPHVVPSLPAKDAMRTNEVIYLQCFESSLNVT